MAYALYIIFITIMVGEQVEVFFITFPILCYFWVLGLLHRNIFLGTNLFNVEAASLVSNSNYNLFSL